MITTCVILDCETSDLPENTSAALLEVGWVALGRKAEGDWQPQSGASQLVAHDGPISPGARAAHHIAPLQVKPGTPGVLSRAEALAPLLAADEGDAIMYAAHNAIFDRHFLPELTRYQEPEREGQARPWLCTLRCARHLYPDAPGHGNNALRYWLGVEPDLSVLEDGVPLVSHRAAYDAAVTAALLAHMLRDHTPEALLALQDKPILQTLCRFGKNRGMKWADVQRDYMRWLLNKSDMVANDPDLRHTVRHHLGLT